MILYTTIFILYKNITFDIVKQKKSCYNARWNNSVISVGSRYAINMAYFVKQLMSLTKRRFFII